MSPVLLAYSERVVSTSRPAVSERYLCAPFRRNACHEACRELRRWLLADQKTRDAGFDSVMWLDAKNRRYVEACVMS